MLVCTLNHKVLLRESEVLSHRMEIGPVLATLSLLFTQKRVFLVDRHYHPSPDFLLELALHVGNFFSLSLSASGRPEGGGVDDQLALSPLRDRKAQGTLEGRDPELERSS